ncbi:helix-turn-helix transcriptional regulator [Entomohabitans teleogrylli]|uniref:helix-turn-helix transcriptional regulator n=1 Tax=Entomohabitans teleogrylli TaxID=1384589 RepID=UPI00073DB377|nr:hypothetical protein [Entomohabitans teleogrylli]
MATFNSPQLRYKFILLTRNLYYGIALHSVFEEVYNDSLLKKNLNEPLSLYLTDKLVNIYYFCQLHPLIEQLSTENVLSELTVQMKSSVLRGKSIDNLLFFVDLFDKENNSFASLDCAATPSEAGDIIQRFLQHCFACVTRTKEYFDKDMIYTDREQRIGLLLLHSFSTKEIAHQLNVSDKCIYRDKENFLFKVQKQAEHHYALMRRKKGIALPDSVQEERS